MSTELSILALHALLIMVTILVALLPAIQQVGLNMILSARDNMPELTGFAGRMDRAAKNGVTGLAVFAPAVLLLNAQGGFTATTLLLCQIVLVTRLIYIPIYAAGTPWLRTGVWVIGFLSNMWLYLLVL